MFIVCPKMFVYFVNIVIGMLASFSTS